MNTFYVPMYFPENEVKRKNVKMGYICMNCGNTLIDKEKLLKKEVNDGIIQH